MMLGAQSWSCGRDAHFPGCRGVCSDHIQGTFAGLCETVWLGAVHLLTCQGGQVYVSEVLETFLCFPGCSMQDPRVVIFLAGLLQAPIFASKFLFPRPCHCFGFWCGRAEGVWCEVVVGSAHMWCCCGWCVLSTVSSTEECLHLESSVGVVSGEAAVQESDGG